MGRLPLERLSAASATFVAPSPAPPADADTAGCVYACASCGAHLSPCAALVSANFTGRTGPALLMQGARNVIMARPAEERQLQTGPHVVADLTCACCGQALGWRYLRAFDASQQYKIGRVVLELARIRREPMLAALPAS
jgi:hypothetical protein